MNKTVEQRLLQTLVPVNSLTVDHLNTLLRDTAIEVLCAGQKLFSIGDNDRRHVYLLSGSIDIVDSSNKRQHLSADDPRCRFPLAHMQPRAATAIATGDCSVIRFDSNVLDGMLAWDQAASYIMLDIAAQRDMDEDADWMITLLRSNLFYKVPPMNIRQILDRFDAQFVEAGEFILRQGELGSCCYFIKEGVAGVYQASTDNGPLMQVAELGVGRFFGEDALINEVPRNATIRMHSNGVLMRLEKKDFYLLLKAPPVRQLKLPEARQRIAEGAQWIDVRTQDEFEAGHIAGSQNMALNLLKLKSRMLDRNLSYVLYCNSGRRSAAAAHLLDSDGFHHVTVLEGGVERWQTELCEEFTSGGLLRGLVTESV